MECQLRCHVSPRLGVAGDVWHRELSEGVGQVWELQYLAVALEGTQGETHAVNPNKWLVKALLHCIGNYSLQLTSRSQLRRLSVDSVDAQTIIKVCITVRLCMHVCDLMSCYTANIRTNNIHVQCKSGSNEVLLDLMVAYMHVCSHYHKTVQMLYMYVPTLSILLPNKHIHTVWMQQFASSSQNGCIPEVTSISTLLHSKLSGKYDHHLYWCC